MWRGEVVRLAEVGSTNTELAARARQGAPAGLVVVADHQTAGRGRRGRRWEAPTGTALLCSVLLRPVLAPARLHLCTAAAALALADGCAAVAGVRPLLKWPNDLTVSDCKLAGILAEADPAAPGGRPGSVAVVVGMGCNLRWSGPAGAGGTSLERESGRAAGRDELLVATLDALAPRVVALEDAGGRAGLVGELRARSGTVGRAVEVSLDGGTVLRGAAVALTEDGHLVVRTPSGEVTVAAGDVVHLRAAPGGARTPAPPRATEGH